jgi:type IV pilus assembly protein PilV
MLSPTILRRYLASGLSLVEVLVAMVILSFGLLGLAALQSKTQLSELESYQRAQAVVLRDNMVKRISARYTVAAAYVTGTGNPLGTGDSQPTTCNGITNLTTRDQCIWSNQLKGASEKQSSSNVGAMVGARGCVEQLVAEDPTPGICRPGVYRVSIAWQGLYPTVVPGIACGKNAYGTDDSIRRLISAEVQVGLPACSNVAP